MLQYEVHLDMTRIILVFIQFFIINMNKTSV